MVVYAYRRSRDPRHVAFERVRRAFRWTVAGATTAVIVIVGVVAHEIPGRSTSAATASNTTPAVNASPTPPPTPTGGGGSPSPPVTAPTPTQQAPTAVSGGTGW
ncbi:MAG TPA: hypothetical protein VN796_10475 [Acidimicrobiales bacterium]|nr:hypothetical protein [Acidimicrobiales bacterium]